SLDERIVSEVLLDHHSPNTPARIVVVADATNLKRGLLLLTQIIDLGLPTVLVLTMMDLAAKAGISYDLNSLSRKLGVPVIPVNARNGVGVTQLLQELRTPANTNHQTIFPVWKEVAAPVKDLRNQLGVDNDYEAYLFLEQPQSLGFLNSGQKKQVDDIREKHQFFPGKFQGAETIQRYSYIQDL